MSTPAVGEWSGDEPPVDEPIETIGADLDLSIGTPGTDSPPPPRYATLPEFVDDFLLEIAWTGHKEVTWCPQWWKHPGAIVRLDALHRAFEHLRLDPATGMSAWLRDHADHHFRVLTDPNGVFRGCSESGHDAERERVFTAETAPDGLFAAED